ncbi:hypothetical protein T4D_3756 [Trichinella pseudospiralis]|uniref:Uncharacterized protein n=1 Tax=Trichinella pseudospiralis TaxID=6337 RepID=A0A0V1G086_TRIPS|nr:hypothetical protein T4D_3756 [Trichinella pseudospiralis]
MIYQTVCTTNQRSEAAYFISIKKKLNSLLDLFNEDKRVRRKGKNRPVSFHLIDLRIHHYHHHHHHHRRRQRCRRRRCLPLTSSKRRNSENSIYFDIDRKRFLTINFEKVKKDRWIELNSTVECKLKTTRKLFVYKNYTIIQCNVECMDEWLGTVTKHSAIAATLLISVLINCSNDTIVNLMPKKQRQGDLVLQCYWGVGVCFFLRDCCIVL